MTATAPERVDYKTGEVLDAVVAATFNAKDYLSRVRGAPALEVQQALGAAYEEACRALIGPNDTVTAEGRTFKKKSAWLKLARHFGISTYVPDDRVQFQVIEWDGSFVVTVVARAVAPWGQTSENVGACSTDEATGRRVITKADAIATAATRALNRAISNLIAMGEVSAEEIGERKPQSTPPKSGNAATWKGKLMTDMETKDLVGLRAWFVKQDPEKWAEKIDALDEVLAGRGGE